MPKSTPKQRSGRQLSPTQLDVARKAGVSHAAPYRHYPNHEALLVELAIEGFSELCADIAATGAESDPVAAAIRMRSLLKHRSLIVLFTELEDATVADPLARAVRLLSPPHLVVAAGVRSAELLALAAGEAHSWRDPWVALAARERETRAAGQRALLQRLGAPVVAEREERLQPAVLAQYELLRRARRI